MGHKTKTHFHHLTRRSVVYRFIAVVLCVFACGQSAQAGNRTLVYEQAVTCFDSSSFSQSMFFLCWDTYRVDSIPADCQGIVIYIRDEHPPGPGECIKVTMYIQSMRGVDTLYNCCGDDGQRIVDAVPIGSFVAYRHPADDTQWISPAAITVVKSRPSCIREDCINKRYPVLNPD